MLPLAQQPWYSGGGPSRELIVYPKDWSGDNRFFLYHGTLRGGTRLYLLPVTGEPKPQPVVDIAGLADGFRFSPDNQWVAYASNDTGKYEVYIAPLAAPAERRQISIGGGVQPTWRKDGKEVFYLTQEGKLMSVDVTLGSPMRAGVPKPLFQSNATAFYSQEVYSPTADGNRFLFVEPETREAGGIHIVLHWDAGLRPPPR
jgi:eukaryotic-like serine/threonine-protein kinase